jgi:hypothetical protein
LDVILCLIKQYERRMRRSSSALNIKATPNSHASKYSGSNNNAVGQLKEWRLQFEKSQTSNDACPPTQRLESPNYSPTASISSNDEGYTYIFDEHDHSVPLEDSLDSPKQEKTRSSSLATSMLCGTKLHAVVLSNDVKKVRTMLKPLLRRRASDNANDNNADCCILDVNAIDKTGSTPLFLCKTAVMTDLLLAAGADIDVRNKDGLTALHKSALFARVDVVCRLLEGNARMDVCDNRGRNAWELCQQRLLKMKHKNNSRLQATMILLEDHAQKSGGGDGRGGSGSGQRTNNRNGHRGGCRCVVC